MSLFEKKPQPKLPKQSSNTPSDNSLFRGRNKVYAGGWSGVEESLRRETLGPIKK